MVLSLYSSFFLVFTVTSAYSATFSSDTAAKANGNVKYMKQNSGNDLWKNSVSGLQSNAPLSFGPHEKHASQDDHLAEKTPLSFASYYGDHMVLQQKPAKSLVWGYADSSQLGARLKAMVKGPDGYAKTYDFIVIAGPGDIPAVWRLHLDAMPAGGPYSLTVTDGALTVTISDVLFGDVWVCSGQSNMEFTVSQMLNASAEIATAGNFPHVRLFTASKVYSATPLYDLQKVDQKWAIASKASVGGPDWAYFSAVCWVFGRQLQASLGYPVGLVDTNWGGTPVEAWSSPRALKECGITQGMPRQSPSVQFDPVLLAGASPLFGSPPWDHHSVLWNAMVHPMLNMTIYGAIWYQGEANAAAPDTYNCTFPTMIADWRRSWHDATDKQTDTQFPFGFVQLGPNRKYSEGKDVIPGYADIRWHQTADIGYVPNARMPRTFMATAVDLTDDNSPYGGVHIRDKGTVGSRLARAGLVVAYGRSLHANGPQVSAFFIDIGYYTLKLEFDEGKTDIQVRSSNGFEVCCRHDNLTFCAMSGSEWSVAPVTVSDRTSVTLDVHACSGMWVMGVRYIWRETPCQYKKCAVYSVENELPLAPFLVDGIIGP